MNLSADSLRADFAKHFSYERLKESDIVRLGMFVMHECAAHNLYGGHVKFWVPSLLPKHGVRVTMSEEAKDCRIPPDEWAGIQSAFIRVNGTYFKDREAISFNDDGYIGFCGWAGTKNALPFYRAFARWMNEMRFGSDRVRSAEDMAAAVASQPLLAPAC